MQRVNIIRFQAYRNLISWISSFCYTALLSVFWTPLGRNFAWLICFFVRPAWVRRKWETGAGQLFPGYG